MDWPAFFEDNDIEYVTRGPNTAKWEISIKCPWCGEDDPSEHMGVNTEADGWGCRRNERHRGYSPVILIAACLGSSHAQAKLILRQYEQADPEGLGEALAALEGLTGGQRGEAEGLPSGPVLPLNFKPLKAAGTGKRFWHYLKARGFYEPTLLTTEYNMRYCTTGYWKDRVLLPFYRDGKLLGWTGRAIGSTRNSPRYLSDSEQVKTTVLGEDEILKGGKLLIITEGPFDALKLDFYSKHLGVRATCVFGTSMTADQIYVLTKAAKKFKKVLLLFDPDAVEQAFNAADWIRVPNMISDCLPPGIEDPGAMTEAQVLDLVLDNLRQV